MHRTKLTTAGDTTTETFGQVTITTTLLPTGIALYVTTGVTRNAALSHSFTNREFAATWYRTIRDMASTGHRVTDIENAMSVLIDAGMAVECADPNTIRAEPRISELRNLKAEDADVDVLVARINAHHDEAAAARKVESERLKAEDAKFLADLFAQRDQRRNNQATRHYREVRPTKTRVFLQDPTPAQVRALNAARNGVIYAGNGISKATLKALHEKTGGTLNYVTGLGRRKVIESLTLHTAEKENAA